MALYGEVKVMNSLVGSKFYLTKVFTILANPKHILFASLLRQTMLTGPPNLLGFDMKHNCNDTNTVTDDLKLTQNYAG